jgi:hypothetical protein
VVSVDRSLSATDEIARAFTVLELSRSCSPEQARAAFRRLIGVHHPDRHNGSAAHADASRKVIEAFRLVRAALQSPTDNFFGDAVASPVSSSTADDEGVGAAAGDASAGTAPTPHSWVRKIDADTLSLRGTADESYARLLEIGHLIGEITYVDRQNGLFESLLRTVHGEALSVVCTLQGRSDETTEAFFTIEPLGVALHELPDIDGVTELVAYHLRQRW